MWILIFGQMIVQKKEKMKEIHIFLLNGCVQTKEINQWGP